MSSPVIITEVPHVGSSPRNKKKSKRHTDKHGGNQSQGSVDGQTQDLTLGQNSSRDSRASFGQSSGRNAGQDSRTRSGQDNRPRPGQDSVSKSMRRQKSQGANPGHNAQYGGNWSSWQDQAQRPSHSYGMDQVIGGYKDAEHQGMYAGGRGSLGPYGAPGDAGLLGPIPSLNFQYSGGPCRTLLNKEQNMQWGRGGQQYAQRHPKLQEQQSPCNMPCHPGNWQGQYMGNHHSPMAHPPNNSPGAYGANARHPSDPGMFPPGSPHQMPGPCHGPYSPQGQNPHEAVTQPCPGSANKQGNRQRQQRQNTPKAKKKFFESHLMQEELGHGLKKGELIQGVLRINPKNYEECYVPHPDGLSDIYICGLKDRNRAFNTDVVAVKLYPREQWKVLLDTLDDYDLMDRLQSLNLNTKPKLEIGNEPSGKTATSQLTNSEALGSNPTTPCQTGSAKSTPGHKPTGQTGAKAQAQGTPRKRFTTLKEYASTPERNRVTKKLFMDDEQSGENADAERIQSRMDSVPIRSLVRTAKIVGIIETKNSRSVTGHLKLMTDSNPDMALFIPIDHRSPRIMIPMSECPKDFYTRPGDHEKVLFVARVTDWQDHSQFARGKLHRSLGEAGEIEPETEGMLIEYGIDFEEFNDQVLECLPQQLPWTIPTEEFAKRKDLRDECVFTIDPATARDLDDALHVKELGDGLFEVGVHIADVSFFVKDGTELDSVAGARSTSVYLVQKVIPMLPRLLCEELCSLNPGKERLTFSVIWVMNEDGEIIDEWFGRTVIKSCVKMSYEHAQGFIEEPDRNWTEEELPPISGGYSPETLKRKTLHLQRMSKKMRKKRFDDGALRLDQVKLSFTLDNGTGMPNGFYVYQQRDSNKLIEEFMLLANMAVAHRIYKSFPELSVLRRHPAPQSKMMDDLVRTCRGLGVAIDVSNSKTIHDSIIQMAGDTLEQQAQTQILTVLCSKPMQHAKYFCTGMLDDEDEYRHYALNVPLYTHFTSPIRRFPDVMVHRLLAAALGYRPVPSNQKTEIHHQTELSNDKKIASKRVQELSSEMFFAVFVKECGPLEERAMVMGVLDKSFDVLVLKLGVVKRVYCERLALRDYTFHKLQARQELRLVWDVSETHPQPVTQNITIFSLVNVTLIAEKGALKWNAITKHPDDAL